MDPLLPKETDDLSVLARRLRALPPSCGPVRLVGVDGHAGSGKSTFAAQLAEVLGGAPVLRLDDLATHSEFFQWTDRLREQVLRPFRWGHTAFYRAYDWQQCEFGGERALLAEPVVLLDGVGAGRRGVRPHLAQLLWMECAPEEAWERGRERDGAGLGPFWDEWTAEERAHFADDPSRPYADLLVLQQSPGYAVLPGPRTTAS
ncbi:aminodeoxychorismate synthase [Nocardia sp. NPDC050712]|uniref:uridine kinase family protein n=1 Tax=Nocardia sp. NPDC050712 TaxID=3155518 RepID=UPI003405EAC4